MTTLKVGTKVTVKVHGAEKVAVVLAVKGRGASSTYLVMKECPNFWVPRSWLTPV
jgi:hypothetical protein